MNNRNNLQKNKVESEKTTMYTKSERTKINEGSAKKSLVSTMDYRN